MRGTELVVEEDSSDEDDAWYPHELAGLRAEHVDGRVLGEIIGLEHLPAHDMLVLREPDGARTLIPFVKVIVPGGRRRRRPRGPRPARWSARLRRRQPGRLRGDRRGRRLTVRIDVVSIFPEYLAPLDLSLVGKARTSGLLDLRVHDLRDWTTDRHRTVDDTPFGGGAGMVMRPDVWGTALDELLDDDAPPAGADAVGGAVHAAHRRGAGRRAATWCSPAVGTRGSTPGWPSTTARGARVTEFSLGDYVLNGGEVAALVVVEAVARLLPGVVGNPESLVEESHGAAGLLEYPVYTKPPAWAGLEVPEVLLSGHHARIARWRRDTALERTAARRPDLIDALPVDELDKHDLALLATLGWQPVDGRLARA